MGGEGSPQRYSGMNKLPTQAMLAIQRHPKPPLHAVQTSTGQINKAAADPKAEKALQQ